MPIPDTEKEWKFITTKYLHAIRCIKNNSFPQAARTLKQILEIDSTESLAYYFLSIYYFNYKPEQNLKMSRLYLETSLRLNPNNSVYDFPLMPFCQLLDTCERQYREASKFEGRVNKVSKIQSSAAWYGYFNVFYNQGDLQKVKKIYQRLFSRFQNDMLSNKNTHAFMGNYGNVLYDLGLYQEAIARYEKEIEIDNTEVRFFSNSGLLYYLVGNYEKSEQYILKVIQQSSSRNSVYYNYAFVMNKTNRIEEAIENVKIAISKDNADPLFLLAHGLLLLKRENKRKKQRGIQAEKLTQEQLKEELISEKTIKETVNSSLSMFETAIESSTIQMYVNRGKRIVFMSVVKFLRDLCEFVLELLQEIPKITSSQVQEALQKIFQLQIDYLPAGCAEKNQIVKKIADQLQVCTPFYEWAPKWHQQLSSHIKEVQMEKIWAARMAKLQQQS